MLFSPIFDSNSAIPVKFKLDGGKDKGVLGMVSLDVAQLVARARSIEETSAAGSSADAIDERKWMSLVAPEKLKEKVKAVLYEKDAPQLEFTAGFHKA